MIETLIYAIFAFAVSVLVMIGAAYARMYPRYNSPNYFWQCGMAFGAGMIGTGLSLVTILAMFF